MNDAIMRERNQSIQVIVQFRGPCHEEYPGEERIGTSMRVLYGAKTSTNKPGLVQILSKYTKKKKLLRFIRNITVDIYDYRYLSHSAVCGWHRWIRSVTIHKILTFTFLPGFERAVSVS